MEPAQADCLLQSAIQGRPAKATGTVDSVMAGLACGETSPLAWRFLQPCVDVFMTIEDEQAIEAMRTLAQGSERDTPIVAGESGVAGLAALEWLRSDPQRSEQVGLTAESRVLIMLDRSASMSAADGPEDGGTRRTRLHMAKSRAESIIDQSLSAGGTSVAVLAFAVGVWRGQPVFDMFMADRKSVV